MDVFGYRNQLIADYSSFVKSFINIRDQRIRNHVDGSLEGGAFWPEPLIQLNPSFEPGSWIDELVSQQVLHPECARIFRLKSQQRDSGRPLRLHRHQTDAILAAQRGGSYVLTTGTASGKSLAYIVPIVDHVLRRGSGKGIQAIVVYPMNALANSQYRELQKFLGFNYPDAKGPVTFARYTGQEDDEERNKIIGSPPDILLTNYVMLELILTRPNESRLISAGQGLRFLVFDELHTYRGRQGADVALLIRRVRDRLGDKGLQCVGTSATIAGTGTYEQRRIQVSAIATKIFGDEVKPENVIGETLIRTTPAEDSSDISFTENLKARIESPPPTLSRIFRDFIRDPLAVWVESTFGLTAEPDSGRLVRTRPRNISGENGAARELHQLTGVPLDRCVQEIQRELLAGYDCEPNPETGFPVFAFRLHQFISRGDTVYTSIEAEDRRYITLNGQMYVPGDRDRVLLPLVFCRECGQEYYCVRALRNQGVSPHRFVARQLSDQFTDTDSQPGFLYHSSKSAWPLDEREIMERLPDDWIESTATTARIRPDRRSRLPVTLRVATDGQVEGTGIECSYVAWPFLFCLECGVAYMPRQRDDFAKLATLGSEGRSSATTITSLSAIKHLRRSEELNREARKLLSFTDNRQDASLQAGHFNDFVEIGILRAAIHRAVADAGTNGVEHDQLTQKVFDAINLPPELYASSPDARFQAFRDTQKAMREVLGYRIYRDLKRGWRITSPNLEQCGLLVVKYLSLDEVASAGDLWENCHPALEAASPKTRQDVCQVLLDYLRRELAIKVDYLEPQYQERIKQQSNQRLIEPWAIDENEQMEFARVVFPRARTPLDSGESVFLTSRGGFGLYLMRPKTFSGFGDRLRTVDAQRIIPELLDVLCRAGLLTIVAESNKSNEVPGYQVLASAMLWTVGDGTSAFHDPIRRPNKPAEGSRTNPFFVEFYRGGTQELLHLRAREHTAQVEYSERQRREEEFREGRLPILYCSPTMELGVDIAQLNVVNMRNVPPTPANYAQRSGRAGRSGQPALVFSYCSLGSSHDQYFFRRPDAIVAGEVSPPRIDLTNEDLIRAHVNAIWLAETGQYLGKSLRDILDLSGDNPSLALLEDVRLNIGNGAARTRARSRAMNVLDRLRDELISSDWYREEWLDEVLEQAPLDFDRRCERWRSLYRAAFSQVWAQTRIANDPSRPSRDREQARRLRHEAEAQLGLLTDIQSLQQSDFYSYRYFASEGFLPGYSFPRLPISAFIPARRTKQRDEFLSRARFLAISEFGPRAVVYHEGSRYTINKVILSADESNGLTRRAKICPSCSFLHPIAAGDGVDRCERCSKLLDAPIQPLFKMQNVATVRRDRISSDEEERIRLGYEVITSLRFAEHRGQLSLRTATVSSADNTQLTHLAYGQAATVWRINLGWLRRKDRNQLGFVLDLERGFWAKNEGVVGEDPDDAPLSGRQQRVIPYVEDTRNCLLWAPQEQLDESTGASLMAALKQAIQAQYQLEDNELAAEILPGKGPPGQILLYEAAEGGAGVLKQIIGDPEAIKQLARKALEICHFDPDTGDDLGHVQGAREDQLCEAACYRCLMNYYNQRTHPLLDRKRIRDSLLELKFSSTDASPAPISREEHLQQLMNQAGSELERSWLRYVDARGCDLPSDAQVLIESCRTRPDFLYRSGDYLVAIYVDGPHHEFPNRRERDRVQTECMEDSGYTVVRFGHTDDWEPIIARYPYIFRPAAKESIRDATASAGSNGLDLELYDSMWHPMLKTLADRFGAEAIEPGADVSSEGSVVGSYFALVSKDGRSLHLVAGSDPASELVRQALETQGRLAYVVRDPKEASSEIGRILEEGG